MIIATISSRFFHLTLQLPPSPLFSEEADNKLIPQVTLESLMSKFECQPQTLPPDHPNADEPTYHIKQLPKFLILHIKRFSKHNWSTEMNPTIVKFPIKGFDMAPCKWTGKKKNSFCSCHLVRILAFPF